MLANPLARKIQNMDDLVTAMADLRALNVILPPNHYSLLFLKYGRLTEQNFYLYRYNLRFHTGYWVPISAAATGNTVFQDNTLHVSKSKNGTMVAFYTNEDKQRKDICDIMRYGRYLTKYHPELNNEQIKELVADFEYAHGNNVEVLFGESQDDFIRAINEGPSESCMQGMHFRGHVHPAAAYAYGDIKIAWIERDGNITARTLINKDTKEFTRVYGDENRLKPALEDMGYTQAKQALIGCRLLKIENENDNGGYIMPYVDRGTSSGHGSLPYRDSGDCFYLGDGDGDTCDGNEQNGLTMAHPEYGYCDCCGDALHVDDAYIYSEHEQSTFCNFCAGEHWEYAYISERIQDYVCKEEAVLVNCIGKWILNSVLYDFGITFDAYRNEYIELCNLVTCIYDNNNYNIDDCTGVTKGENTVYIMSSNIDDSLSEGRIIEVDGTYYVSGYEPEEEEELAQLTLEGMTT